MKGENRANVKFNVDIYSLVFIFSREESPAPEAGPSTSTGEATVIHTGEPKPVERSVEFRNTDDAMASMVRSLYFADTYIVNGESLTLYILGILGFLSFADFF